MTPLLRHRRTPPTKICPYTSTALVTAPLTTTCTRPVFIHQNTITMSVAAPSLFNVDGLVALVTGGGTGIGLMMAKGLAQNGAAKVYIAGRRLDVLQAAAQTIGGTNVVPLQCDVTNKEDLARAVQTVKDEVGYLNLLVCNSGILGPHPGVIAPDTTVEDFSARNMALDYGQFVDTFSVNVAAVWFGIMAFLPLLDAGNKKANVEQTSQVIVTSSIAGMNKTAPGGWAYGQSKAAAIHLVKQLSALLPQWKMRANCIAPGFFPSQMTTDTADVEAVQRFVSGIPLQRMGDEQDMAGTLLYLASRAGGYANGSVVTIDGGRLSKFPSTA